MIVLGAHPYTERLPADFEEWGQRYIDCGVKAAIARREAESDPLTHEQKAELQARDWKALGAALVATGRIQGLTEGLSRGRIPYLLLCGTGDEDHDLARQAADEFPNVSFRSLEGLDHHESRSRLDILIPVVRKFFGASSNLARTRAR